MAGTDESQALRAALGLRSDARLGEGGEAVVYALDAQRVARVYRPGATAAGVAARAALLREIDASRVPFAIPQVLETRLVAGRLVTLERRLPGRPLHRVIAAARGPAREALLRAHLDAADRIGELRLAAPLLRRGYGDLLREPAIRTPDFRAYVEARTAENLRCAGPDFAGIDVAAIAAALPAPETPAFVHFDAFAANMLGDESGVTAVLDFGGVCMIGDRRHDPVAAVAYLAAEITPTATRRDREIARVWLAERGLEGLYEPVRRFLAAFWCAARGDAPLHRWCRRVLLEGEPDRA